MSVIDLSKLPPPAVIEELSYEQIIQEMLGDLAELSPGINIHPSDPSYKVLAVAAVRELNRRQQQNERIRKLMAAYAKGDELDHIGRTYYATERLVIEEGNPDSDPPEQPVYESDEDYLRRFLLAPDGWSTAGPREGYIYHALSADGSVLDVHSGTPAPMEVLITVLSREGDGEASTELLNRVYAAVNDEKVRPQTDLVTVQSASIIPYQVIAQIEVEQGPDPEVVRLESESAGVRFIEEQKRLGNTIVRDALLSTLYVPGVRRVHLNLSDDVECEFNEAAHCELLTVDLA